MSKNIYCVNTIRINLTGVIDHYILKHILIYTSIHSLGNWRWKNENIVLESTKIEVENGLLYIRRLSTGTALFVEVSIGAALLPSSDSLEMFMLVSSLSARVSLHWEYQIYSDQSSLFLKHPTFIVPKVKSHRLMHSRYCSCARRRSVIDIITRIAKSLLLRLSLSLDNCS